MTSLNDLAEMEHPEPEYIAEILPVDAQLSFTAPVSVLVEIFSRAASVTPVKETLPGTTFALLEVEHGTTSRLAHARLTASDGDQTVSVLMDQITVHMEGAALLPARRVHEILKLAPVSTAKLEVVGQTLTIRSGRALWSVQVPVGESMPSRLDVSEIEMHVVSAVELGTALSVARTAASNMNARMSLTQVLLRNGTVTGCDGGRLHRVTVDGLSVEINVTIPIKSVDEILKALKNAGDVSIRLGYNETHIVVEVDDDIIVAQRLLVAFPDIEPLILGPTFDNDVHLTVSRVDLLEAVKRVRVNADPDSAAISLNVIPSKGDDLGMTWILMVQAKDRVGNASKEAMLAQWSGIKPRTVTLNHHYLTDMLSALHEETVTLKFGPDLKTAKSPILIEGEFFTGVIQQMALVL